MTGYTWWALTRREDCWPVDMRRDPPEYYYMQEYWLGSFGPAAHSWWVGHYPSGTADGTRLAVQQEGRWTEHG